MSCVHCGGDVGRNHAVCDKCFASAMRGDGSFERRDQHRETEPKVINLMDALKASIEKTRAASGKEES